MRATDTGAPFEDITGPISEDEATEAFLKHFMPNDANKPSDDDEDEDKSGKETDQPEDAETDDSADDNQPNDSEETDEGEEGEANEDDEKKRKYAEDDVFVKIKVGDEEHAVPVKELQRLYGQEASLTKKSMEVAEKRRAVDDELTKASVATSALLERAKQRWEPFSKVDFLMASNQLSPEDYTNLRDQAMAAHQEVQFLEQHLNGLVGQIKERQQTDLVNAARESLKVLSGPAEQGGINGWSEKLYNDIRSFAVAQGAPVELVDQVVEPWAIRMMHDAMLYRRGQSKVITKKVNKTPKKVIKTTANVVTDKNGPNADKEAKAMKRLAKTGSADDAAEAFLARWQSAEDTP